MTENHTIKTGKEDPGSKVFQFRVAENLFKII